MVSLARQCCAQVSTAQDWTAATTQQAHIRFAFVYVKVRG